MAPATTAPWSLVLVEDVTAHRSSTMKSEACKEMLYAHTRSNFCRGVRMTFHCQDHMAETSLVFQKAKQRDVFRAAASVTGPQHK